MLCNLSSILKSKITTLKETINFYAVSAAYGEFSNFALFSIKIKGEIWPTIEHYFQAQKFVGTDYETKIRKVSSPMKAAELGRSRKVRIRKNWDSVRDQIMYEALQAKYTQYQELKKLLLETGDKILVEHTQNDHYWGDGGDGSGKNKLGKLLMKLREELRA